MEPVEDQGRVGQPDGGVDQGRAVAGGRVEGGDAHALAPRRALMGQPSGNGRLRAFGHHIEHLAIIQVDQHGGLAAASPAPLRGSQPGLLVQAKRRAGTTLESEDVLLGEQLGGAVLDRVPHQVPADPEVACDRGDRLSLLADPAGRLGAGPAR